MIKIIPDFLPKPLFKYLKQIVESEKGMLWCWNYRNLAPQNKAVGAENYKLGKTLYCAPELEENGKENYDKELMPLFGVFQLYMMEHMQDRCKTPQDQVLLKRMKMNLYPNPNNGDFELFLNNDFKNVHIEIIDILGRQVYSELIEHYDLGTQHRINLDQLSGTYILQIVADHYRDEAIMVIE